MKYDKVCGFMPEIISNKGRLYMAIFSKWDWEGKRACSIQPKFPEIPVQS